MLTNEYPFVIGNKNHKSLNATHRTRRWNPLSTLCHGTGPLFHVRRAKVIDPNKPLCKRCFPDAY